MIDPQRLLARFLRYVQIDTTARENAGAYPSSAGQLTLGRMLADELQAMGATDVLHDEHGLVWATVPGNAPAAPAIAFNAHLDTSPETSGANVQPQVVRNYPGGDLALPGDRTKVIRLADNPELANLAGCTLITSDGTTLLGADDKAGVAVIMETVCHLLETPAAARGTVRVVFTCDEEIGHGVDHVDLVRLGAAACYTLDGYGAGEIDVETFSADLALVTIEGVNIHPSIGKGRLVNAVRIAAEFLEQLPKNRLCPEATDGRDGFLHPYAIAGGVAQTRLRILLRDFDTPRLADWARLLSDAADTCGKRHPQAHICVEIVPQYRNLGDGLTREPRAVAYALEAYRRLGRTPKQTIIRGGTDGSRFTELGLPTPNLSTGEHNPHSPLEWTCLEEMAAAAEVLVELAAVWAKDGK